MAHRAGSQFSHKLDHLLDLLLAELPEDGLEAAGEVALTHSLHCGLHPFDAVPKTSQILLNG